MRPTSTALGVAAALALPQITAASVLTEWNLIARNSVNSSSEVDGSALIGGDLTGPASNYAVQGVTAFNGTGLAVGGNITAPNIQINNAGDLRVSGTVFGNANLNGGGAQIADPSIPALVSAAFAQVNAASSFFSSLTTNGNLDTAGNMNASPATISGQSVAVYSISQSQIQSLGQLNLNLGSADTVVINFTPDASGAANFIAPPNIIGGFNQNNASRIIWNIPTATSVTVNNSFNGALLAPNADLQLLGGGINGTVVVNSISTQDAEIRRFNYTGAIPTPATAALAGVAGIAAGRRRR